MGSQAEPVPCNTRLSVRFAEEIAYERPTELCPRFDPDRRHRGPRYRHRLRHSVGRRHSVPEQGCADGTARCRRACLRPGWLSVGAPGLHERIDGRIAAAHRGARDYSALIPAALAIRRNLAISLLLWRADR